MIFSFSLIAPSLPALGFSWNIHLLFVGVPLYYVKVALELAVRSGSDCSEGLRPRWDGGETLEERGPLALCRFTASLFAAVANGDGDCVMSWVQQTEPIASFSYQLTVLACYL